MYGSISYDNKYELKVIETNCTSCGLSMELREGLPEEVNLHTFRHTSVFLGVLSGSDILAISKRLGHKSIRITADTYSDLFKETDIELADKLADLQVKTLDQEFPETKEQLG